MRVCGIDVGLTGGLAVIGTGLVEVADLPVSGEGPSARINAVALMAWLRKVEAEHAFIENANAHPDQGVSSVFRYGRAVGAIEAAVACAGIPYLLVTPQSWKKMFGLKGPNKERSREMAIRMFPGAAGDLTRKKDHGRAEALLIAKYGQTYLDHMDRRVLAA